MQRIGSAVLFALASCSPAEAPPTASSTPTAVVSAAVAPPSSRGGAPVAPASAAGADAGAASPEPERPVAASIGGDDAERVLFLGPGAREARDACPASGTADARIRCLLGLRFKEDPSAAKVALDLYEQAGDIAGVEHEHVMEGGFRGKIHLVPEPPVGRYRKHLEWALGASRDFDAFFAGLEKHAKGPIRYRWRAIALLYFRSVGRTTPSAYAQGWSVAYNVSGSLHGSADAVRETLFHEIFHLNDAGHGRWSRPAVGAIFDGIVRRCGTNLGCLTPFAPNTTTVRGGTYYAFQPDNGDAVNEYTAELAIRYYREHRAILRGEAPLRPAFKCGPKKDAAEDSPATVNGRAWKLLVDEFFGGVDLVPPC